MALIAIILMYEHKSAIGSDVFTRDTGKEMFYT